MPGLDLDGQRLLGEKGCLTPEGLDVLRNAMPGALPEAVVRHFAACATCQRRALEAEAGPRAAGRRSRRAVAPSPTRLVVLVLTILVAFGLLLLSLAKLAGR